MKKSKRLLFMSIAFMMIPILFLSFSVRIFADTVPTVGIEEIFANGIPITIEAGSNSSLTKIKYGDNKYLEFGRGMYEADLSNYSIFGGSDKKDVDSSSITITGGRVGIVLGGGRSGGNVNGDVLINISDGAQVRTLYGGGDTNSSVTGKVTINISGGVITETVVGGGSNNSPVKGVLLNITNGKMSHVYGGGFENSNVNGDVNINITGESEVGDVFGGTFKDGIVSGNTNINISGNVHTNNVYGGGVRNSIVQGNTNIHISENATVNNVYGGGEENSSVEGNANIDIFEANVLGVVNGGGLENSSVNGRKDARVLVPADVDASSFTNLISRDQNGHWNVKGSINLKQDITVSKGNIFNIPVGSVLTLDRNLINHGTLKLEGELRGSGTLEGDGTFLIASNENITENDIDLQMNYVYTGDIIKPVHGINKKIRVLNREFEISNWKFEATEPAEVKNVGQYILKYKKDNEDVRVSKIFNVVQAQQEGRIQLGSRDTNNDKKLNAGDVLFVNMANLKPKGGTPSYSWKKKSGKDAIEITKDETYTLKSGDEGQEIYCVVTFSGNTKGSLETNRAISKLPAPKIEFPTASSISFGKKLKDSTLKGGSTQYGTFAWKDPEIVPAVNNTGYEVQFTANPQTKAKYEEIIPAIKKVPITVHKDTSDNESDRHTDKVTPNSNVQKNQPKVEKDQKKDNTQNEKIKFTDVKSDDYFADAVIWAIENGITMGTSENTFSPYAICSRGEIVTFLWRAAGSPKSSKPSVFHDVALDRYYAEAVKWAAENHIVSGTSADSFSPALPSVRAQAVTMLYRHAGSPEVDQSIKFNDVKAGSYYEKAVVWAAQNGITKGTSENTFSPDIECNRAQIITFLYRLYQSKVQK